MKKNKYKQSFASIISCTSRRVLPSIISFTKKKTNCPVSPIKIYSNAEADKAKILKENKKKSGIYM